MVLPPHRTDEGVFAISYVYRPFPAGQGAPSDGLLSGQFYCLHRLSRWPLHRRLQDGKEGIGGEQDKLTLLTCSRTVRLAVSPAPAPIPQYRWEWRFKISRLRLEMTVV